MYKLLTIFHDIDSDSYRGYISSNSRYYTHKYINTHCRNNEEALIIDTNAGVVTDIYRKKNFSFFHLNLIASDRFLSIEQLGLNWSTMKELARSDTHA